MPCIESKIHYRDLWHLFSSETEKRKYDEYKAALSGNGLEKDN